MKRVISLLLLVLLIIFGLSIYGCTKSPEPKKETKPAPAKEVPALKPGDYFPLTVGSSWEYQGEGNEYATFNRKVLYTSGNLAQIREDNGGTVIAAVFKTTPKAVTRIFFLGEAYGEDNYLKSEPNENIVILQEPLKVGTNWREPNGTREIVDVNASVDTPAGNFDQCIKVKISSEHSTLYEYFKKGVGMVKREFFSEGTSVTSSLEKYSIK